MYDEGKNKAKIEEVPLYLVENESYIYYNKVAIVMYKLQEIIGEDNVNYALRTFIKDWNSYNGQIRSHTDRYATSEDLISYILNYTPAEQRIEVSKLFDEI